MASRTVNFGIAGLGWPGQMHSRAIQATPGARLVAIADASPERCEAHRAEFPVDRSYRDYHDLLADSKIDAVIICLPNFLHFPASLAALRAGKHVLCEKPPTMNAREMRRLRDEAARAGLTYAFARQMRFGGEMITARRLVASGRLGDVYFARTTWHRSRGIPVGIGGWFLDRQRAGGGAIIDIGIHTLDAAWFALGCPRPVSVTAGVFQKFAATVPKGVVFDVDDSGFAFIRFDGGQVLSLETTWASNLPENLAAPGNGTSDCLLLGSKAGLQLNPLRLFTGGPNGVTESAPDVKPVNAFARQMADFVRAVRTGSEPTNNAGQGLALMQMLDAIYRSGETGREVRIR